MFGYACVYVFVGGPAVNFATCPVSVMCNCHSRERLLQTSDNWVGSGYWNIHPQAECCFCMCHVISSDVMMTSPGDLWAQTWCGGSCDSATLWVWTLPSNENVSAAYIYLPRSETQCVFHSSLSELQTQPGKTAAAAAARWRQSVGVIWGHELTEITFFSTFQPWRSLWCSFWLFSPVRS